MNYKLSEILAFVGGISPQSVGTTAVVTSYIEPTLANKVLAVVSVGTVHATGGSISLLQAADTSGTSATALASTSVASNSIYLFDFNANNTSTTLPYLAISVVGGDNTGTIYSVQLVEGDTRYLASDLDSTVSPNVVIVD